MWLVALHINSLFQSGGNNVNTVTLAHFKIVNPCGTLIFIHGSFIQIL